MKNNKFNGFDDLHVSEHAKTELLNKIEMRKQKQTHRVPAMGKVLISFALIGAVMIYASTKQGSEFLDYEAYLTISAEEVDYPMEKIQQEMSDLDIQFDLGMIEEEQYQLRMKELKAEKEALIQKANELKKQFKLDQELNLDAIKFSHEPLRDQQLKEFYLQKTALENTEAELNSQNDELMAQYEAGEISWQEYIDKKLSLDKKQEDLYTEKDQWEASYASTDEYYQKLYEQKKYLEEQEDALELEEDLLKEQYKQGWITREEYKAKKAEIELKEDELDMQDDQLDNLGDEFEDEADDLDEEKERIKEEKEKEAERKEEEREKEEEAREKEKEAEEERREKEEERKADEKEEKEEEAEEEKREIEEKEREKEEKRIEKDAEKAEKEQENSDIDEEDDEDEEDD